jgi:hypothetical protein
MALATAVLLWTVPRFEAQSTQVLDDIPVRVDLTDPGWAQIGTPSPDRVSVTLSGPARDLIAIALDPPPVYVPMGEVLSEDTTVDLRTSWFRGSVRDGVVVEGLSPGSVSLSFEQKEDRVLPFSVPLTGELPEGTSLAGRPRVTPPAATVVGPPSRFEGVDSVPLLPVDLSLVVGPGPFTQGVDMEELPGLDPLTREASVDFPTDSTVVRQYPDQVLELPLLDSGPQLQARPISVSVVLTGAASLVDQVDPEAMQVTIPDSGASLAPGEENREVLVIVKGLPEWVEYSVTPARVLVLRPVGQ